MLTIRRHVEPATSVLSFVAAARSLEEQGNRVARLDIGEPHFATAPHIIEAAAAAMRNGRTKYVAPQGLPLLRQAIAEFAAVRGLDASAHEVVVSSGVKPMLAYVLLALVQRGDDVLVPESGYAGYAAAARLAGASARGYPVVPCGDAVRIDLDALERSITPATRVLVLNSPHNPSGMIIDRVTVFRLAEIAEQHDLWIVSDEIYHALTYDGGPATSIASVPGMRRRTIVVDGFSKAYAMTGWRLGFAILPPALVATITSIVADAATCTPSFVQHAGVAALTGPQDSVYDMRRTYRENRDLLVGRLRAMPGVRIVAPAGALYAFADVTDVMNRMGTTSSAAAAMDLLERYRVACVPGTAFGPCGAGYLRLSFAIAADQLAGAILCLEQWARDTGHEI